MKYEITGTNGGIWTFDNQTCKIESINGYPNNIEEIKKLYPVKNSFKLDDPFPAKSKRIKKLRIQLGTNCNYKCSFCLQGQAPRNVPAVLKDGQDKFFEKLDRVCVLDPNAKIELWGGEPLVYWKSLINLIPELRRRYPKAVISMISNGTLMTDNILKFLIEHNIALTFSHDAMGYFLRGPDPLNDEEKRQMWIRVASEYKKAQLNFGFNVVISQYTCDLFEVQRFFAEKVSPEVPFGFEGVVLAHATNVIPITKFPEKEAGVLRQSIIRAMTEAPESNLGKTLIYRVRNLFKRIAHELPCDDFAGRCDVNLATSLIVDLHGNVLACHNPVDSDQIIGSLDDFENIRKDRYIHWKDRKKCKNCLVLPSCHGSCIRASNYLHESNCETEFMLHRFLFEGVWIYFTGAEIANIRPLE